MGWRVNTWTIERGGDHQIPVLLLDVDNVLPINIANATAINLLLKNADGSVLSVPADQGLAIGVGNILWVYSFPLTAAQTALLPIVHSVVVEVAVFWGLKSQKYLLSSSFTTIDPVI